MKSFFLFGILYWSISFNSDAQLRIAQPFTDHMVLQRNKPIPIWGWASKNEKIAVQLDETNIQAQADANGKWMVNLPARKEGGPYKLTVRGKQALIQLNDIMLGEVWLCSGQSNMEFEMRDAFHFNTALGAVHQTDIRQFIVPNEVSLHPNDSIKGGEWVIANPSTLNSFTAVGYSFAAEVAQKLHVTVGLIKDAWGGSQIEGWISQQAMLGSDELKEYAQHFPSAWEEADALLLKNLQDKLGGSNHQIPSTELSEILNNESVHFDKWLPFAPPSQWDWQGIWALRGAGFFERTIFVNANEVSKPSILSLGENDGILFMGKTMQAQLFIMQ